MEAGLSMVKERLPELMKFKSKLVGGEAASHEILRSGASLTHRLAWFRHQKANVAGVW